MNSKKRCPLSKDELSLRIGLFVLVLSLELFIGIDTQGCGLKMKTFAKISHSAITISKNYENYCCISLLILFMYASQTLFFLNNNKYGTNKY